MEDLYQALQEIHNRLSLGSPDPVTCEILIRTPNQAIAAALETYAAAKHKEEHDIRVNSAPVVNEITILVIS